METKLIAAENRDGYSVAAVQFIDDDYTSSVVRIPSAGITDDVGHALSQATKFAAIAAATAEFSRDGGVRNALLEGAARALSERYGW